MSDFKIRFRDPQNGRQIEVNAEEKARSFSGPRVDKSFEESTVTNDGTIDVVLQSDAFWTLKQNTHLGVDTSNLSKEDASALKRALEHPDMSGLNVFRAQSGYGLRNVSVLKTDAAGELTAMSDNLDTTGSRREVRLTPEGHIATLNGGNPETPAEVGEGLFRAASLIDDVPGNLFDQIDTPLAMKEKMFANLAEAVDSVRPGSLPAGMDTTQGLQMRSSAATTMLELMTSKHDTSREFKGQVLETYTGMIEQETNPLLKDSMIFNLNRLKGALPSSLRGQVDGLMETIAPTKPPYETWFKDGNNTVNVTFVAGDGESYKGFEKHLQLHGFEKTEDNGRTAKFTRTIEHNGKETTFALDMRYNSGNMYNEMDDDNVDVLMYSGHSNWGRNVRDSLGRAPKASGDGKVVLTDLCVGKGEIQMTRDAFPDAHLITTYNSSYYRPNEESEGLHALLNLVEGIARREGYETIADNTNRDNPWRYTHERNGLDNNFIFPTDLETRRRVLDQDHDGQADVFDRMVDFNTFDVKTDTAREFQAIEPSRETDTLVGTKLHFASQTINRMAIYSGVLKNANSTGEVVPAGFFDPEPGETGLFRFEKSDVNGRETVTMAMNANYAHMSEEALRMAASYEYGLFAAEAGEVHLGDVEAKLNAMVFASHSLYTDKGYRDSEVWSEFTKAYNFPNISRSDVEKAKKADDHYYSGSHDSIRELKNTLGADVLSALEQSDVGVLGG